MSVCIAVMSGYVLFSLTDNYSLIYYTAVVVIYILKFSCTLCQLQLHIFLLIYLFLLEIKYLKTVCLGADPASKVSTYKPPYVFLFLLDKGCFPANDVRSPVVVDQLLETRLMT